MITLRNLCILTTCASLLLAATSAQAAVIYADPFEADPGANGWTESVTGDLSAAAANTTIKPNANSTAASFIKAGNGATTNTYLTITKPISTIGYEDIEVTLVAYQNATAIHGRFDANAQPINGLCDYLTIEYSIDGGATFAPLLTDYARWNGVNETPVANANWYSATSNTTPTSTGALLLPAAANENSDFVLRIGVVVAHYNEGYFVDDLTVSGTPIPEPASLALIGCGAVALLKRRRG
jgi:hypothetical protein